MNPDGDNNNDPPMTHLGVRIPVALKDCVVKRAAVLGVDLSQYVRSVLQAELGEHHLERLLKAHIGQALILLIASMGRPPLGTEQAIEAVREFYLGQAFAEEVRS